jgi:hypothetical protein
VDIGCLTVKYDPFGNVIWSSTQAGGSAIAVDGAGNAYITGGGAFTVKLDASGNVAWTKTYSRGFGDSGNGITIDAFGYVYVAGTSYNNYNADFVTIKYDSGGNTIWVKIYDAGSYELGQAVAVDAAGCIYVTGGDNNDYRRTIKYDANGNILWNKLYNGGDWDRGFAIAVDQMGNSYVTGGNYTGGISDYVTVKYDPNGNVAWAKTYYGDYYNLATGIAVDESGGIYVTGTSQNASGYGYGWRTFKYHQNMPPLAGNLPAAGKLQVRNPVVRIGTGTRAHILARAPKGGGNVEFFLYTRAGLPLGRLGTGPIGTDANDIAHLEFDGTLGSKPLATGMYWIVTTGAVSSRHQVMVIHE